MMDNIAKIMEADFGVKVDRLDKEYTYRDYEKVSGSDFAKINACFRIIPDLVKNASVANMFDGTYRVMFDRGLGELQRAAVGSDLYRANVVAHGTNNNITGQALLQELDPQELMKVSNVISNTFTIASIVTSQYYLKDIDSKLEKIEKQIDAIKIFLEKDKESQLWANGEILKDIKEMLQYIMKDDVYRQSTIISVQAVKRDVLACAKLYFEQLKEIENNLNVKDDEKEVAKSIIKCNEYLNKMWYATYLYEMAYTLEAYLSRNTDKRYLQHIINKENEVLDMYKEAYIIIRMALDEYINKLKCLKTNEIPAKLMKSTGKVLQALYLIPCNLGMLGAKSVGIVMDVGADHVAEHEKNKKEMKKQEVIDLLSNQIIPCADLKPLRLQIETINRISDIANKRFEVIIDKKAGEAYIKMDDGVY